MCKAWAVGLFCTCMVASRLAMCESRQWKKKTRINKSRGRNPVHCRGRRLWCQFCLDILALTLTQLRWVNRQNSFKHTYIQCRHKGESVSWDMAVYYGTCILCLGEWLKCYGSHITLGMTHTHTHIHTHTHTHTHTCMHVLICSHVTYLQAHCRNSIPGTRTHPIIHLHILAHTGTLAHASTNGTHRQYIYIYYNSHAWYTCDVIVRETMPRGIPFSVACRLQPHQKPYNT